MRPVELTIEGLRSFRRQETITFADRELTAIIGDTGAGKSSILEALTWALYGNATWTKQASSVLIGDACPQMRVRLVFTTDGNQWQVTRAVKRRQDGTVGPTNAELVCLDDDRPAADGVRQVDDAIRRLLGLDWEAFTRTVVLPQGQFARLLTETDTNRVQTLQQIWRTDELIGARSQVDDALQTLTAHLQWLRGRRQGYPADVDAELETARSHQEQAQKTADTIDGVVEQVQGCRDRLTAAGEQARRLRAAAEQIEGELAANPAGEADRLARLAHTLDTEIAKLDDAITTQKERVGELEGAAEEEPSRKATEHAVTTLQQLATSVPDLAEQHRHITNLHRQAADAKKAADRLAEQARQADEHREAAEADLEAWRRVDAAATAAHGLHAADDCPVCTQPLPDNWAPPEASGLETATKTAEEARTAAQTARGEHQTKQTEATNLAQQAQDETGRLDQRLQRAVDAVAALAESFQPHLPEPFTTEHLSAEQLTEALVEPALEAARARKNTLDQHAETLNTAHSELNRLRKQHTDLRERRHREVTEPTSQLRNQLRRLGERIQAVLDEDVDLTVSVPEPREPLSELAADTHTATSAAQTAASAAREAATAADAEAAREHDTLTQLLADAGVEQAEQLDQQRMTAHSTLTQAKQRVADLEAMKPKVEALDAHLAKGDQTAGALTDLKTLLQDSRFIRWLTLRRSRALLAVASTLLEEMTGGRYLFADITDERDEWRIFDTETGYARSPRTLSGGESFVASLALALGMVEMVARSGGRLDALFLDEGFGTLDRDNLDAAIAALETSATRGRMVAVISHVQTVAERLDHVLAVDRTPHGSQTRWLSPGEREGMATAEASNTIQNLLT